MANEILEGLSSAAALRALIAEVDPTLDLRSDQDAILRPIDMVSLLEQHGLQARIAKLRGSDLRHVRCPVLLELIDRSWVLLKRHGGTWKVMDGAQMYRHLSPCLLQRLPTLSSGTIIEQSGRVAPLSSLADLLRMVLRKEVYCVSILAGLAVVVQLLWLAPPFIFKTLIDESMMLTGPWSALILGTDMLATGLVFSFATSLQMQALDYLQAQTDLTTRHELITRLLNMPFSFLQEKTSGELMKVFTNLGMVWELISASTLVALTNGALAPIYLALIAMLMRPVAVVLLVATVLLVVASCCSIRFQSTLLRKELDSQSEQHNVLSEIIGAVETIRTCGSARFYLDRWLSRLRMQFAMEGRRLRTGLLIAVFEEVVSNSQSVLVLFIVGFGAMDRRCTVGAALAVIQLSTYYSLAAGGALRAFVAVRLAKPKVEGATDILRLPYRDRFSMLGTCHTGHVILDNVSFRYTDEQPWVIRGCTLEIKPGRKIRVPGASGSGKTTLLRLVAGFYAPSRGSIRIDGHDPVHGIKGLIYLPQFVHLFRGSILENLRILSGHAPIDSIVHAAEMTGLDSWISQLPMMYETMVNAGGAALSGGQRQLIALTAVAASEARVCLLDEAMANLDVELQIRILHSRAFADRTIIYASHSEEIGVASQSAGIVV
jgi:ATP-binding cassette subfamily B protein